MTPSAGGRTTGDQPRKVGGRPEVHLLVSVDTEEDQWGPGARESSAENIRALPRLHRLLEALGVRPTYFTTYQVAADPSAASVLRELAGEDGVEIGAHLHPWNTPPPCRPSTGRHSMLNNLPRSMQKQKLTALTSSLTEVFHARPSSFRGGRLGLGSETVDELIDLGYEVDSTVTPFMNWAHLDGGPDFVGAPVHPYRLGRGGDVRVPDPEGEILEIPISTGYTRLPFEVWDPLHRRFESIVAWGRSLSGILSRTGIVRKVVLNPELERTEDMVLLSRNLISGLHVPHLQLFLHSSSLEPGLSPFASSEEDVQRLLRAIARFVEEVEAFADVRFATTEEFGRRSRAMSRV